MSSKKISIKIGIFISILMLLILPLLSSPVAAAEVHNTQEIHSDNAFGGVPSVTCPGYTFSITTYKSSSPRTLIINCVVRCEDNCGIVYVPPTTPTSFHQAELNVEMDDGVQPPSWQYDYKNAFLTHGAKTTLILSVSFNYVWNNLPATFDIIVVAQCDALNQGGQSTAMDSDSWNWQVVITQ